MRLITRSRPRNKRCNKSQSQAEVKPAPRSRQPKPTPTKQGFTVSSRITQATGEPGNYALNRVRALPGPRPGTVLLQATDGHQAVCLVTPGELDRPATLPSRLVRNLKTTQPLEVEHTAKGWAASNGQTAADEPLERFPEIAEVLPKFSNRRDANDHLSLSFDVSLLVKITEALGTSKVTLLIPRPNADEATLSKAVAVCPAEPPKGSQPDGVAVFMPITPHLGTKYYRKLRRDVVAAESSLKPRSVSA